MKNVVHQDDIPKRVCAIVSSRKSWPFLLPILQYAAERGSEVTVFVDGKCAELHAESMLPGWDERFSDAPLESRCTVSYLEHHAQVVLLSSLKRHREVLNPVVRAVAHARCPVVVIQQPQRTLDPLLDRLCDLSHSDRRIRVCVYDRDTADRVRAQFSTVRRRLPQDAILITGRVQHGEGTDPALLHDPNRVWRQMILMYHRHTVAV